LALFAVLALSSIAYYYYLDGYLSASIGTIGASSSLSSSSSWFTSIPFTESTFSINSNSGSDSTRPKDDTTITTSSIDKTKQQTRRLNEQAKIPVSMTPPIQNDQKQTTKITQQGINYETKTSEEEPLRVLHIVTALAEYNNGRRSTVKGEDRLQLVMIPILVDSVQSMISEPYNYQVDVYLVLGWKLLPERRQLIEDALPEGVGLQIWDDATPLGYDSPSKDVVIKPVTRGLARQHRFVIKDKLDYYDFFTVFEDDMRVTGGHIAHYLEMTDKIQKLREEAPDRTPEGAELENPHEKQKFHGSLTKQQLRRMIPGFIRVEALTDQAHYPSQEVLAPIPVDLNFSVKGDETKTEARMFDAQPCCHVRPGLGKLPPSPKGDEIMIWETEVFGAVVREMPESQTTDLGWVLLQPGPKKLKREDFIGGYWSGRDGAYGSQAKPTAGQPHLIAQQGGFMLTREQVIEIHLNICDKNFLPPFDSPPFNQDGLTLMNVEFWSGGYQLFGGGNGGCSMQRVIDLDPDQFSKHFIYHTANNKQMQIAQPRLLKANNFMGQLNTVVKAAKVAKSKE